MDAKDAKHANSFHINDLAKHCIKFYKSQLLAIISLQLHLETFTRVSTAVLIRDLKASKRGGKSEKFHNNKTYIKLLH